MKTEKDDSGVSPASGTPRFTHNEKSLLYKLFQDNEDVIDIKFRKVWSFSDADWRSTANCILVVGF